MDNEIIQAEEPKTPETQLIAEEQSIKIKISRKTAIIIVVIIILGVLVYVSKGFFVAALVNGSPISRFAIIQKLEKTSGKALLDSLITEKLIQNEVESKKIVVSSDEINAEIKIIEDQIVTSGGTIDAALASQGMSLDDLRKQIALQKEMEKLVADKINVTDQEVAKYISDNKIPVPVGQEATTTEQIRDGLRGQKLNTEAQALITDLKARAKIQYFVNY